MGMPVGEAVVFFDKSLAEEFAYRCKQAGQLASKMRFITAPWSTMLQSGALLRHARNANARARQLATELEEIPGVELLNPCEANSVFVRVAPVVVQALRDRGWFFYEFIGNGGIRLMCSWDTTEPDVDAIVADFRLCVESHN
jgi:threonine aldolase